jgi:hypothetical protein
MAGKSDYLENKVLDLLLGAVSYTVPTTVYIGLYTVAPTDAGGGTEVSGGGYARVAVTNNTTNFPTASNGSKSNGTTINFPTATADWGTVVAVGIFDASTAGNLLFWANLTTSKVVQNGDTAQFASGSLTFSED